MNSTQMDSSMLNNARQPVLFLSHGGGPLPLLNDPGHAGLIDAYAQIRNKLKALEVKPSALLFISAHWEADEFTITAAPQPSLYYDYYGFPDAAYQVAYPVPGAVALANRIRDKLNDQDMSAHLDETRGLDHGVFVPGIMLFPEAEIPCLQLSLLKTLDPAAHLKLGQLLQELRQENVMIIGSGFSFHNMRAFFQPGTQAEVDLNLAFEGWLSETLLDCNDAEREQRLLNWETAPGARFCHPREEHLLPIHVCAGAAYSKASQQWRFTTLGREGSCYWWD